MVTSVKILGTINIHIYVCVYIYMSIFVCVCIYMFFACIYRHLTHTHIHWGEGLSLCFQACFRGRGCSRGRKAFKGLTGVGTLNCWEGLM